MSQPIVQSMGAVGDFQCVGILMWEPWGIGGSAISVMVSWGVACFEEDPIFFCVLISSMYMAYIYMVYLPAFTTGKFSIHGWYGV